ncbi:hypothetical protein EDEG_03824 [Edhazardia aedis USNM 41457]|uniref:ABC transporter domain-containing protein n=1 Tax=Edhazardia aedis (strain USNM 41457) TaxID=1003232 RepID=J9DJV9_EDHAE|nr:hypothetical protein EDEG_03824 [Edhazardia aedis USNM 41457]|eukprot:EJW01632.1 hypothetical protein EDEG_03824 [Edhazardia aedis USNM 41457]
MERSARRDKKERSAFKECFKLLKITLRDDTKFRIIFCCVILIIIFLQILEIKLKNIENGFLNLSKRSEQIEACLRIFILEMISTPFDEFYKYIFMSYCNKFIRRTSEKALKNVLDLKYGHDSSNNANIQNAIELGSHGFSKLICGLVLSLVSVIVSLVCISIHILNETSLAILLIVLIPYGISIFIIGKTVHYKLKYKEIAYEMRGLCQNAMNEIFINIECIKVNEMNEFESKKYAEVMRKYEKAYNKYLMIDKIMNWLNKLFFVALKSFSFLMIINKNSGAELILNLTIFKTAFDKLQKNSHKMSHIYSDIKNSLMCISMLERLENYSAEQINLGNETENISIWSASNPPECLKCSNITLLDMKDLNNEIHSGESSDIVFDLSETDQNILINSQPFLCQNNKTEITSQKENILAKLPVSQKNEKLCSSNLNEKHNYASVKSNVVIMNTDETDKLQNISKNKDVKFLVEMQDIYLQKQKSYPMNLAISKDIKEENVYILKKEENKLTSTTFKNTLSLRNNNNVRENLTDNFYQKSNSKIECAKNKDTAVTILNDEKSKNSNLKNIDSFNSKIFEKLDHVEIEIPYDENKQSIAENRDSTKLLPFLPVKAVSCNLNCEIDTLELKNINLWQNKKQILKNINIEIKKGEKIAVIGKNGTGKSTFIRLIAGLNRYKGEIKINQQQVDTTNSEYKNIFTYGSQNITLFDSTIMYNILYGSNMQKDKSLESIKNELVCLCNEISLSKTLDSKKDGILENVGANGCYLSGGERQKIILARTLWQNKPVILLDEPTSNLDKNAELAVIKTILSKKDKIVIMTVHNMSLLRMFDKVIRINDQSLCVYNHCKE